MSLFLSERLWRKMCIQLISYRFEGICINQHNELQMPCSAQGLFLQPTGPIGHDVFPFGEVPHRGYFYSPPDPVMMFHSFKWLFRTGAIFTAHRTANESP